MNELNKVIFQIACLGILYFIGFHQTAATQAASNNERLTKILETTTLDQNFEDNIIKGTDDLFFTSTVQASYGQHGTYTNQFKIQKWSLNDASLVETYDVKIEREFFRTDQLKAYDELTNTLIFKTFVFDLEEEVVKPLPKELITQSDYYSSKVLKVMDGFLYYLDPYWNFYMYDLSTNELHNWPLPEEWERETNDLKFYTVDTKSEEWIFYQPGVIHIVDAVTKQEIQEIVLNEDDSNSIYFDMEQKTIIVQSRDKIIAYRKNSVEGYEPYQLDPVRSMLEQTYNMYEQLAFDRRYSWTIKNRWREQSNELHLVDHWFDTKNVLYKWKRSETDSSSMPPVFLFDDSYVLFSKKDEQSNKQIVIVDRRNFSFEVDEVKVITRPDDHYTLDPIPIDLEVRQGRASRLVRNRDIDWTISDPTIAQIDGSFLIFLKEGSVTIEATILGQSVSQTFSTKKEFTGLPTIDYTTLPSREVTFKEGMTQLELEFNENIDKSSMNLENIHITKGGAPVRFTLEHWSESFTAKVDYQYEEGTYEIWLENLTSTKGVKVEPVHWPIEIRLIPNDQENISPLDRAEHNVLRSISKE